MQIFNCIIIILLIHIYEIYSLNIALLDLIDITSDEIGMNDLLKSILQSFVTFNITHNIYNLSLSKECITKLNSTYFLVDNYEGKSYRNQRKINKTLYFYTKLFLS